MLDAEGVYSDHQENALVGIWGLSSLHSSPKPTKHYLNHHFSSLHPFSLICSSSCLNSSDICTSLTKSQGCVRYGVGGDKYTIYNGLSGHRNKESISLKPCNKFSNREAFTFSPSSPNITYPKRFEALLLHHLLNSYFEIFVFCLIITMILLHCPKKIEVVFCDHQVKKESFIIEQYSIPPEF